MHAKATPAGVCHPSAPCFSASHERFRRGHVAGEASRSGRETAVRSESPRPRTAIPKHLSRVPQSARSRRNDKRGGGGGGRCERACGAACGVATARKVADGVRACSRHGTRYDEQALCGVGEAPPALWGCLEMPPDGIMGRRCGGPGAAPHNTTERAAAQHMATARAGARHAVGATRPAPPHPLGNRPAPVAREGPTKRRMPTPRRRRMPARAAAAAG